MNPYYNLRSEMKRRVIMESDIARILGIEVSVISRKIRGNYPFSLNEAFLIKKHFFPDCNISYLFCSEPVKR